MNTALETGFSGGRIPANFGWGQPKLCAGSSACPQADKTPTIRKLHLFATNPIGQPTIVSALLLLSFVLLTVDAFGLQRNALENATRDAIGNNLPPERWDVVDPLETAVPQVLLPLIHSVEVQTGLGLDDAGIQRLERVFSEIDGPWLRSRNLPEAEKRGEVSALETRLLDELEVMLPAEKFKRLQQLELQAQASRLIRRSDVAQFLKVDAQQMAEFIQVAEVTDQLARDLSAAETKGTPDPDGATKMNKAKQNEITETVRLLTDSQKRELSNITGETMDLTALSRIFPMAPELIVTDGWFGTAPGTLEEMRGKVVLVHFYAFQCINCQRNLPRYNDWGKKFANHDVVIVGIQTPETSAERDASQICKAAEGENIQYPVLLDLQSKNWAAWSNTMWPTVYVIDKKGYIRYWWQGELNWQGATGDKQVADLVNQLLKEE